MLNLYFILFILTNRWFSWFKLKIKWVGGLNSHMHQEVNINLIINYQHFSFKTKILFIHFCINTPILSGWWTLVIHSSGERKVKFNQQLFHSRIEHCTIRRLVKLINHSSSIDWLILFIYEFEQIITIWYLKKGILTVGSSVVSQSIV